MINPDEEIEWEITSELIEEDSEERMEVFRAIGEDKNGKKYEGCAFYICGEFDSVQHIDPA